MVDIADQTQNITITLVGEGQASIQAIPFIIINGDNANPVLPPFEASVGDSIQVIVEVLNLDFADTIFAKLTDTATGVLIERSEFFFDPAVTTVWAPALGLVTMPTGNLNLDIEVGHVE